jgi:hypothetical protein
LDLKVHLVKMASLLKTFKMSNLHLQLKDLQLKDLQDQREIKETKVIEAKANEETKVIEANEEFKA